MAAIKRLLEPSRYTNGTLYAGVPVKIAMTVINQCQTADGKRASSVLHQNLSDGNNIFFARLCILRVSSVA